MAPVSLAKAADMVGYPSCLAMTLARYTFCQADLPEMLMAAGGATVARKRVAQLTSHTPCPLVLVVCTDRRWPQSLAFLRTGVLAPAQHPLACDDGTAARAYGHRIYDDSRYLFRLALPSSHLRTSPRNEVHMEKHRVTTPAARQNIPPAALRSLLNARITRGKKADKLGRDTLSRCIHIWAEVYGVQDNRLRESTNEDSATHTWPGSRLPGSSRHE
jgi:hypothetical protein